MPGHIVTDWREWLDATTRGHAHHVVSARIGRSPSTVGRWARLGRFPADGAIDIARAYGGDPVAALIATGWLTVEDMMNGGLRGAVAHAPTAYLVDELRERQGVSSADS